MTKERIPAHSTLGRLLMAVGMIVALAMAVSAVVLAVRELAQGRAGRAVIFAPVQLVVAFAFFQYTRHGTTAVFMTPEGLELGDRADVVPWVDLERVQELWYGGQVDPLCRLHFRDRARSLTLYIRRGALDELRARVRSAAPRSEES